MLDWRHSRQVVERKVFNQLLMDRLTNKTLPIGGRKVRLSALSVDQIAVLSREVAEHTVREESNRRAHDPLHNIRNPKFQGAF